MAKRYRRKDRIQWSQKKIKQMLIITAILIVPPFILWGISTAIRSNRNFVIGKIGNWTITRPLWNREYTHTRIDYLLRIGDKTISPEVIRALTWNRIIQIYIAQKHKVRVSDEELAKWIQSLPIFQDKTGNFSLSKYQKIIHSLGIPEKAFEETIRENLMMEKLKEKITQHISVTKEEIKKAWKDRKEKFKIRIYPIWIDKIKSQIQINEDEIKEYYHKHKNELVIPDTVDIEYLIIPRDKYQAKLQDMPLEKLAEFLNLTPKKKNKLTPDTILPDIGFNQDFYSYAFSLPEGKTSPIFPLANGKYCLLKVIKKTPKHIGKMEEVKDKIEEKLKTQKAIKLAQTKAQELLKKPEQIKNWEKIQEFSPNITYLPLIGRSAPLIEKLRNAIKKNQKRLIFTRPNAVFIVEIIKHSPAPDSIPEKIKKELEKSLLELKKESAYQKFMTNEIEKIKIVRKDHTN